MSSGAVTAAPVVGRRRVMALVGATLIVVGGVAGVVTVSLVVHARSWAELPSILLPVPWLVAAALAVRARPDHPGALLFLGLGVGHLVAFALAEPISLDDAANGWGPWVITLVSTICYFTGFASLGAFLSTYPTGRPVSVAGRRFVRGVFVVSALAALANMLTTSPVTLAAQAGRATIAAPPGLPLVHLEAPYVAVGPFAVICGAAMLVVRGRRSSGDERRQLSWAVGAAGVLALLLLATPAIDSLSPTVQATTFFSFVALLPFVLLAGMVRYRLMDVDVYVARTLARGVVVVLVLSLYAFVTAFAGRRPIVAALVVVVAALTGVPVVRRLEGIADRLLSGGRVRGQALLRQLAEQSASPSRAEQAHNTAQLLRSSMDASWVAIVDGDVTTAVAGSRPGGAMPEVVVALVAGTADVGRLECGPRHGNWGAAEVAELELLARHVALRLHNADLTQRLEHQVVELTASRRRIVRAELAVRKQLERELHDGVAGHVVALISQLGALRVVVGDGGRAADIAAASLEQAQTTLTELRNVVTGVQPPVLVDRGLVAAVESRVSSLPVPVRVVADDRAARWPSEVETAAYYVVAESLTNVVKHARAQHADVVIECRDGELVVSVTDDGGGLPPGALTSGGTGLSGLRDRIEALDGSFDIVSSSTGTTITARLPVAVVAE